MRHSKRNARREARRARRNFLQKVESIIIGITLILAFWALMVLSINMVEAWTFNPVHFIICLICVAWIVYVLINYES